MCASKKYGAGLKRRVTARIVGHVVWRNTLSYTALAMKYSLLDCFLQSQSVTRLAPEEPNVYRYNGNQTCAPAERDVLALVRETGLDFAPRERGEIFLKGARSINLTSLRDEAAKVCACRKIFGPTKKEIYLNQTGNNNSCGNNYWQ